MRINHYVYISLCILSGCSDESESSKPGEGNTGGMKPMNLGSNHNGNPKNLGQDTVDLSRSTIVDRFHAEYGRLLKEYDQHKTENTDRCIHTQEIGVQLPNHEPLTLKIKGGFSVQTTPTIYTEGGTVERDWSYVRAEKSRGEEDSKRYLMVKAFVSAAGSEMHGLMLPSFIDLNFEGAESLPQVCKLFNFLYMNPLERGRPSFGPAMANALRAIAKLYGIGFGLSEVTPHTFSLGSMSLRGLSTYLFNPYGARFAPATEQLMESARKHVKEVVQVLYSGHFGDDINEPYKSYLEQFKTEIDKWTTIEQSHFDKWIKMFESRSRAA